MSEVEKMYENTGINKETECNEPYDVCSKDWECNTCPYANNYYPKFTTEKQLSLTHKMWQILPNVYPNFDLLVDHSYGEMIATFVNNHWQGLSEEERKQIQEILE